MIFLFALAFLLGYCALALVAWILLMPLFIVGKRSDEDMYRKDEFKC